MATEYKIKRVPIPPGIRLIENVYLTMKDGIKIATDVYLPEKEGKYPVILAMCPYKKEAQAGSPNQGFHSEGGDVRFYVPKGYAMVFATVRGAGFSQGLYGFMGPQEQKDSYDIVEGIAKQPWCNGNIGMLGGSYLGKSQYYTAAQHPPHLKCITPCDASTDTYRDLVYQGGGMFHRGFLSGWGVNLNDEIMYPGPIDGKLPPPNLYGDWLSHQFDGPWYEERSGLHEMANIEVPVLAVMPGSAWLHSRGMLRGLHKIKSKNFKVLIAPSIHGMINMFSTIAWHNEKFNSYVLRWFDHWLKGIDTGIMKEPQVIICDTGTGESRYETEIPPLKRTQWTKFYLHPNPTQTAGQPQGFISAEAPGAKDEPLKYKSPRPRADVAANKQSLVYTTPPMEKNLRIWGPISATIYGSTATSVTDLWAYFVKMADLAPDGSMKMISRGCLKACYREVDESKSDTGRPWHPFTKKVVLEPDKIYDFQIDLNPMFHTFQAGHKIWVGISSDDTDFKLDNYTDPVPANFPSENSVYQDKEHASFLLLPIVPDAPIIAPIKEPVF